jgi:tRNA A22 N-methylase
MYDDIQDIKKIIEERNKKIKEYQKRLINVSRVREYIKEKNCEINDETIDAINKKLYEIIDKAIYRTKANKRITIRPHDL